MLKRIMIVAAVLSTLVLLAVIPMSVSAVSSDMPKFQTTVEVPVTIAPAGETPSIPVTGGGEFPMSTMIILVLLGIVGLAVVIGGAALLNRRQ